jgi:putative endopeptidase
LGLAAASTHAQEVEPESWGAFGIQTQWMNPAVGPGDDFDGYVNGKWNDTTAMPEDKAQVGAFITLRDLSQERLRKILDELGASEAAPGTPAGRIAAAYGAFMGAAAIDAAGLAPAQPYLDRIRATRTTDDIVRLFGTPGYPSPIDTSIDADQKQSDIYALYIAQGELGLPDRDYYLSDIQRYKDIRAKYRDYVAFLLAKAGYQDSQAQADSVLALEVRLAAAMWDRAIQRNRDLTYNKLTAAELDALARDGLMRTFLNALGARADSAIVVELPPTKDELAAARITPDVLAAKLGGGVPATLRLIDEMPLATWQAWLAARFLATYAPFLPSDISEADFAFYGTVLRGQPTQRARWKRGVEVVEGQVGELLGRIYAERYYPPENKAAMADLIGNLRKAMAANLADLKWMGPETRGEAEAKLAAFTPKIGAPEVYKAYDGLVISPTAPLANQAATTRWQWDYQLARLGKPVDRSEWAMFPQTANAYYDPTFNEIVFPAAILQPPFFNLSADPAVNYGAIGAVIGHEIGHGFDDQGAKSDGAGNLRDWWTAKDKAAFEALTRSLVGQYEQFCPFDENSQGGKACVNGQLTLGENIGDLGGLSLAYRAYKLSLGGQEAPVIDGYTGDQRFFMAYAQVWRGKQRDEQTRQSLVTDPHSPPHYRINGIVRNFDEWYRAFDVKPGDKLYLPPEQRVRIW